MARRLDALKLNLCGIALRNPVIAASGTFGYGLEFEKLTDLSSIGAIVTKGLSRQPIEGNPAPRLWESHGGMINSVGLQNVGVRAFVADKLPKLCSLLRQSLPVPNSPVASPPVTVFANVFGYAPEDYLEVVRVLNDAEGIAAYELNVSCPNTKHGGIFFSNDPEALGALVGEVKRVARRPLIVKLSPNVARIEPLAQVAEQSGADAISLVNTFISLAVDARARRARIGAGFGGLSGPAIKPIALRMVYQAAQAVKIPVIGMGGIATGEDAAEFLVAGATAVEVGTASFWNPGAAAQVVRELGRFLEEEKIADVRTLTGTLTL